MTGFDMRYSLLGEIIGDPVCHVLMTAMVQILSTRRQAPLRILEVGAWIGGSAATWSDAMTAYHPPGGEILCVDPWSGYPVENDAHGGAFTARYIAALEDGTAFRRFQENVATLAHPAWPLRAPSSRALPLLRDGSFDLVYIDGDHSYDACRFDVQEAKRLVAAGGIVCGDDFDVTTDEADPAFLTANRNKQPAIHPQTGAPCHPGVTLAVTEALPATVGHGFWCAQLTDTGFAPVDLASAKGFVPQRFGTELIAKAQRTLAGEP